MARSPFRIMKPFAVSFSGGRTSAYMLRRILDAYDGWPERDAFCLFANTGKERDETLDFIHEIETRWGVPVRWLEYGGKDEDGEATWREVNYWTAHRTAEPGSPYEVLIGERPCLPNPLVRYCTGQLKIHTMRRFLADQGWDRDFHRRHAIGIRKDEESRCIQIMADCPAYTAPVFPLVDAGVDKADVLRFWSRQDFDLRLHQDEGNCDLCFLKGRAKLVRIARKQPELARWWADVEREKSTTAETTGGTFRTDRTFAAIIEQARQRDFLDDLDDDDEIPCACTEGVGDWCDPATPREG